MKVKLVLPRMEGAAVKTVSGDGRLCWRKGGEKVFHRWFKRLEAIFTLEQPTWAYDPEHPAASVATTVSGESGPASTFACRLTGRYRPGTSGTAAVVRIEYALSGYIKVRLPSQLDLGQRVCLPIAGDAVKSFIAEGFRKGPVEALRRIARAEERFNDLLQLSWADSDLLLESSL